MVPSMSSELKVFLHLSINSKGISNAKGHTKDKIMVMYIVNYNEIYNLLGYIWEMFSICPYNGKLVLPLNCVKPTQLSLQI